MIREKMIEVLIENRLTEWVFAGCTDSLEELLMFGWKGYEDYTDEELKEAIEDYLEPKQVKNYLKSRNRRLNERAKRLEEYKDVVESIKNFT